MSTIKIRPSNRDKWRTEMDKKLFSKGPFILQLGPRKLKFKFEENYQEVRRIISTGRFRSIGEMLEAVKGVDNGYGKAERIATKYGVEASLDALN